MPLQGKDGGVWKDASAVYGKSGGSWLYAKEVFAKKDGTWARAWTDCRKFDAGGRGWSDPSVVVTYTGTCGNRTQTTTTTRTKTGCPNDVRAVTVSSPNCDASCFDSSSAIIYSGSCASRTYITRTTYTAKAGSNCTTYSVDSSPPIASPTCEGACTTAKTGTFTQGGVTYEYSGPAGYYYAFPNPNCSNGCDFSSAYYYVTTCGGTNTITLLSSDPCVTIFGDPC